MFKLALIQMRVIPAQRDTNLARAAEMIAEAAMHGAKVILLPECLDIGGDHDSPPLAKAGPIPDGPACSALRRAAVKHGLYLCAGLVEREGDFCYNAAVLIDPKGEVLLKHRKINEVEHIQHLYGLGDRLGTVTTPLGKIGVLICADATARDHAILQTLGYMGADIVLSPAAWAVKPDHDNVKEPYGGMWRDIYRKNSRDFRMWIAGVSNVGYIAAGAWKGWKFIGNSLVFDPDGREVVTGPHGTEAETILYVDVVPEPRPARGVGWWGFWGKQREKAEVSKEADK